MGTGIVRILILFTTLFPFALSGYAQKKLVLEGATLIDGSGKEPIENSIIIIEDGKIAEVGKIGEIKIPKDCRKIKLKGKFVIPGIIDTYALYDTPEDLIMTLAWGVTSINCVCEATSRVKYLKDITENDTIYFPQIYITSPVFTTYPGWLWNKEYMIDSLVNQFPSNSQEAREQISKIKEKGIERVSIIYDNMEWCRGATSKLTQIDKKVVVELLREANTNHIFTLISNAILKNSVDIVDYKPSAFIHGILDFPIDKPLANAMQGRGIFYVPTFCLFDLLSDINSFVNKVLTDEGFRNSLPDNVRIELLNPDFFNQVRLKYPNASYIRDNYQNLSFNLKKFLKNSVKVSLGSSIWIFPGISAHLELENLVSNGMTPMQAIMSATSYGADFLSEGKKIGTIEKGKQADLVILNANPLVDIKNTRDIMMIIKRGVIVERDTLIKIVKSK